MEVFSSSRASSSKTCRGCFGLGTIASTGISAKRAPGTGLSCGSGSAAGVGGPTMAAVAPVTGVDR